MATVKEARLSPLLLETMDNTKLVKISKYLSKHLRHQPERLGLTLRPGGWVPVDALLEACARHRFPITRAELEEVVAGNDKQRFGFDPSGTLIRAHQGHSTAVELELEPTEPPFQLYHGTAQQNIAAILRHGLIKMRQHHVHLSADRETAQRVGARHGVPVVFVVDATAMARNGFVFFRSTNGVWLVDHVPAAYLQQTPL